MKKIVLKVTVKVPDDYVLDDPDWLLENIGMMLNVFNLFKSLYNKEDMLVFYQKYCWQLADNQLLVGSVVELVDTRDLEINFIHNFECSDTKVQKQNLPN